MTVNSWHTAHGSGYDPVLSLASSLQATPGTHAVLLGAGVSVSAGVKSAWGVQEELVRRIAAAEGIDHVDDIEAWYTKRFDEDPTYGGILEKIAPTQHQRQALLREFFEPSDRLIQPSEAHRALARLAKTGAVRVFLTLNFDRLMEDALQEVGVTPYVAKSVSDIEGLPPLRTLSALVVHLHGDYLSPTEMRNTLDETSRYDEPVAKFLARLFSDYSLIIAGWAARHEPPLRALVTAHLLNRYRSVWIDPAPLSAAAANVALGKAIDHVPITADDALTRLETAHDVISRRRAHHLWSVPTAVLNAKRELRGLGPAMDTHDMFRREVQAIYELLEKFQASNGLSGEPGRDEAVQRLSSSARMAAGLVATMAYWGDEKTDAWWFDDVRWFGKPFRTSGSVWRLQLPFIPGRLLFQSAAIAALAAGRYDLVWRLLREQGDATLWGPEPLRATLAANSSHSGHWSKSYLIMEELQSILGDDLGLGARQLEEVWELFDCLVVIEDLRQQPEAQRRIRVAAQEIREARNGSLEVEQEAISAGAPELATALQAAEAEALRPTSELAFARGHIRFHRSRSGGQDYEAPALERFIRDTERGFLPPLFRDGGFSRGTDDALSAHLHLRAVSMEIGRRGNELGWSLLSEGGGVVPEYLWIDAESAPVF